MKKPGFTLIEIVIVMAIAGLLIILVLLAVSGAQRSRRDNQRRHDLARLAAQLEVYASAHDGNYPTVTANPADGFKGAFLAFLPNSFTDPSNQAAYDLELGYGGGCNSSLAPASPGGPGSISYDVPGGGTNPFKVRMCLENGQYEIGN